MKVFVSSTFSGMKDYRNAAKKAILKTGFEPILIEEKWGTTNPKGGNALITDVVQNMIKECDVFVCIIGSRFGANAPSTNTPWVVLESIAANDYKKPILFYFVQGIYSITGDSENLPKKYFDSLSNSKLMQIVTSPDQFSLFLRRDLISLEQNAKLPLIVNNIALPKIDFNNFKTLLSHPDELQKCSPRVFEKLVAELLTADGWDVKLITRSNMPGPDIIAVSTKLIDSIPLKLIVECKRWSDSNPVDIDVVRKIMYWVNEEYRATLGMIATTSRFTREAIKQATNHHEWRLDLKDQTAIINWLSKHVRS